MYNLIKSCNSGWKMTPFAAKLVSNRPCFYHDSIFATGTRVSWKNGTSVTLSVLIGRSALLSNRWCWFELISSLCSDSPLLTTECLQATPSVNSRSSWDGPVYSAATFPVIVSSQFKLDLKERETTNIIKREPEQMSAVELLSNESYATANISLLACLQKSSAATLTENFIILQ